MRCTGWNLPLASESAADPLPPLSTKSHKIGIEQTWASPAPPRRSTMNRTLIRIACVLGIVTAAVTLSARPALAETMYGSIDIINDTQCTYTNLTSSLSSTSAWSTAGVSLPSPGWTANGSPASILGPGQTISFQCQSNGGLFTGCGGSVSVPGVGTVTWSVPNLQEAGFNCGFNQSPQSGSNFTSGTWNPNGGYTSQGEGPGGGWACAFQFEINSGNQTCAASTTQLLPGQSLATHSSSQSVSSSSKTLDLNNSGNLVLLDNTVSPPAQVWASNTTTGDVAYMNGTGNFVISDINGNTIWQTYTAGIAASQLVVGSSGLNNITVYDPTHQFFSWISPGGYFPNSGIWWNQSFDPGSSGEWNYGSYKGTCWTGQPITGVSKYTQAIASHAVQCGGARYVATQSNCHLTAVGTSDNRADTDGGWDWDVGSYKTECAANEYAQGVSQTTSGQLDGILCCPASTYNYTALKALGHNSCSSQVFYSGNSGGYESPDWDYGYYKGQCPGGQYVAGVSTPAYSSIGTYGAAHAMLCCSP
jgi:hypothetical protein